MATETTKQHLATFHEKSADHHIAMAKSEHAKAEASTGKMSECCKTAAANHEAMAEYHAACCRTLKASIAADLEKLVPDGFRGVIPSDVPAFGIRAVSRPGGPEFPAALDKTTVDPRFRHLIADVE
jgi:hypothetical protein